MASDNFYESHAWLSQTEKITMGHSAAAILFLIIKRFILHLNKIKTMQVSSRGNYERQKLTLTFTLRQILGLGDS